MSLSDSRHQGPLGETVQRQFVYSGRFSDGRRETGTVATGSPRLAVGFLMRRRLVNATVMERMDDGRRIQVGGISQQRKGARRIDWWEDERGAAVR